MSNLKVSKRSFGRKMTTWLASLLVVTLIMSISPWQSVASASTTAKTTTAETVTGLQFESSVTPVHVIVDGSSVQMKVLASIKGETSLRDVTGAATWTSSNPSAVTVENGWVKGAGKGTSEITVKYQGFTLKKTVVSEFMYDKLIVRNADSGQEVDASMTTMLGAKHKWKVFANDKSSTTENDVTAEALWSSADANIVDVDKGVLDIKSAGTTKITVKHKGITKTIEVKVEYAYDELKLSPNKLIEFQYGGAEYALTATTEKKGSPTEDVTLKATWTTSDSNIVQVKDGKVKPINVGTATVTVTYLGRSKSVTAVVRPSHHAIRITPDEDQHVMLGDTKGIKLELFAQKDLAAPDNVTALAEWRSDNVMAVTVENGVVQAKAAGTAKVTASYNGLSKSVNVTVYPMIEKLIWTDAKENAKEPFKQELYVEDVKPLPKVQGITFSGDKVDLSNVVTYMSSNPAVLEVEDDKMKAISSGDAQLLVTSNGLALSTDVKVLRKALMLRTDQTDMSIVTGREVALPKTTVVFTNGEELDVTQEIKWETSNNNLLIRDGKMKGLVPSRVTLNGTYSNVKISIKISIEQEVVRFVIEPNPVYVNINKSKSFKVTGVYRDGKKATLTSRIDWKVENESIASLRGSSVKGLALGSTRVIGEYQGNQLVIPVHVKPRLLKLETNASSLKMTVGQTADWKVSAIYDTGEVVDVTSQVKYVPSSSKVKAERGKVTAVTKGSASIKFTFEGKSASMRVSVK
ncbi:bacterial surface protein [Paenibacillus arenosi]|nr:bacterial surface protein [Paenibacillus arenosi]